MELTENKILKPYWKQSVFGVCDTNILPGEVIEEIESDFDIKQKTEDIIRTTGAGLTKAKSKVAESTVNFFENVKENFKNGEMYLELARITSLLKQYFTIKNKSFSLCAQRLQMCLEICSGIDSYASHSCIPAYTAKREREILKTQLKQNKINLKRAIREKSHTLEPIVGVSNKTRTKKASIAAFLIMSGQWFIGCCENFRDNIIIRKNDAVYNILNCATHIGMMPLFAVSESKKKAAVNFTAANSTVKSAVSSFVSERRRLYNENINKKREIVGNISQDLRLANGLTAFFKAIAKGAGRCLTNFSDVYKSLFNHLAPAMGFLLLVTQIASFAAKEYGIEVELDGIRAAVIASDSEYDNAQNTAMELSGTAALAEPKYTLRIINDKGEYTDPEQLATTLLGISENGFTEAYDVVIDGERIGTITDPKPLVDALTERFLSFGQGTIMDIHFTKEIEYIPTQKSSDAISDTQAVIDKLLGFEEKDLVYIIASGDTLQSIAESLNLTEQELKDYNKGFDFSNLTEGGKLIYIKKDYFLPVVYSKSVQITDYVNYNTIEIESDKLYKDTKNVIKAGERGEVSNVYSVTYTNGVESGRELVSTTVIKEPVTEVVGLGTFVAKPDTVDIDTLKQWQPVEGEVGKYIWPLNGGKISARMGDGRGHAGIDIAAPKGTEIYACAEGTIVLAGWNSGYGNCVIIEHPDGYRTLYGHMSEILCLEGQEVSTGDIIGLVGSTGWSSGNHLHIEVHYEGQKYNPLDFIKYD